MSYDSQKEQFATAYRTGSDMWTKQIFALQEKKFIEKIPEGGMVLDIGAGRGRFTFRIAEEGLRVIGLEYVSEIVLKGNDEVKLRGMEKNIRFFEGDALDIPFTDESFDGAADVGLMHHLLPIDFPTYKNEVLRVLKQGAYFFLVVLSKESTRFLSFEPKVSSKDDFEYSGTHYHFFTEKELEGIFGDAFHIKHKRIEYMPDDMNVAYSIFLMQKK